MTTRLEMSAISKGFGTRPVLNQAWLQLRAGEVVGLIGRNGAGKTTLLRIAAGLVRPDSGSVQLARSASVRYFGGEMTLPSHVSARRWSALFAVRSDDRRRIGELSRGNRQRLGLRVALSRPAGDVLLLDEPWEGLDPEASDWLIDRIGEWRASGAAVLLSSHRLHELD
ncbi:MAG TPA: ATP-binding cassette domain-containing protein, partial [Vicinamibacterales bacterium]